MVSLPDPDAEKKRTKSSRKKRPLREMLLRPRTWTSMLAILRAIYGIIRLGAKILEMFS